ncbi:MAG: exosortase/archaeosortase family protein, partial [Candidatus Eisenbacteria bacterium]
MTTSLPVKATGPGGGGRRSLWGIAGVVAVAALVVLVYHQTLLILWRTWNTNPNYSHGFLIPPVVAFLLWRARRRFLEARDRGSMFGLVLVGLALLGQVASIRAGVFMTQGYSLVLMLFGLSLFLCGVRATRTVWFPLGYLVFM